jgi:hypothetical protein
VLLISSEENIVCLRGGDSSVERERGLAHAGLCRHDGHVAWPHPRRDRVEVGEPVRQTELLAVLDVLEVCDEIEVQVADRRWRLVQARGARDDLGELLLDQVADLVLVACLPVRVLQDAVR